MPAECQRAMYHTLIGLKNTFCFLDDILIVSNGSEEDHFKLVLDCLKKLDANNLRINLPNFIMRCKKFPGWDIILPNQGHHH